jgi:outer membrane lipoprotein carrier protein
MSKSTRESMRLAVLLIAGLTGVHAAASPAGGQEAVLPILERASSRYEELDGLCADFTQRLEVPLLDQVVESAGVLCQRDPNLFAMDFREPAGDRIVADGQFLWIYSPSTQPGQVIRQTMAAGTESIDFHREFLEDPGVKYAPELLGAERVGEWTTHRVRLIPTTRSAYRSAEVWLDAEESWIRRIRIEDDSGSVRWIDLVALDLDPPVDRSVFTFEPPDGVLVIRR